MSNDRILIAICLIDAVTVVVYELYLHTEQAFVFYNMHEYADLYAIRYMYWLIINVCLYTCSIL